ncbi:MAG TPA: hypothetical protein VES03_11865 [Motilibacterales bacterium]|nr:hypothetical protein [Motilibacterales bacterium]
MVRCQCGHTAYAGYVAEVDSLAARSSWLADRVSAGDPAPAPEVQRAYAIWSPPSMGAPGAAGPGGASGAAAASSTGVSGTPLAAPPAPARAAGSPSAQTILLGLGALLLVIAGAVFAAVVWDRLGAAGQVSLMLAATAGVGALAIRLRSRLSGTAEALAVVAAGLATIDLTAAPLLGLLPESWISDPTLYPAVAFGALGVALLLLHARFGLRAWSWLGWTSLLVAAACVVAAVAGATDSPGWTAVALSVPALASVAMLAAAAHPGRWARQQVELSTVGAFGLFLSGAGTASAAMERDALPGALVTTAATAVAVGTWAALDRRRAHGRLLPMGAAALSGITVALVLALPQDPQPVWLAAAVALAGLTVGLVLWVLGVEPRVAVVGASAVWIPWAATRMDAAADMLDADLVTSQLSLLAALVAVMAFVVAWWIPATGWVAALLGAAAMLLAPGEISGPIEAYTLSFAALLLVAGALWRRRGPTPSLQWLGPAVAMALIPSALAAWAAPWALDASNLGTTGHLLRLGGLLVASVIAVVLGARLQLAGLLIPASVALVITAGAQAWSGLSTMPRWIALAIAGTLLVLAGARIEWLRREGRRAVGWVEGLD